MNPFPNLFSPAEIGGLSLRNRLVMSPMETLYATPEGLPSPRTIAYYEARARGGVGLITTGASCIDARHKELPSGHHFGSDDVVDSHRALTDAVHALGAKIQPQIAHAGPDGVAPQVHGIDSLGPSAIQSYLTGTTSKEISQAEFEAILDQYRAAAARVRASGYDGLELHAAHGYMLLGSFLTSWRNARSDAYSGRNREGRLRAVVEAIRAIRSEVGPDFPLTLRISGYERIPGGRALPDTAQIAPTLEAAGVDAFHVTGGVIDRYVSRMVNGAHDPDALNVAQARAIKNVVDVPVMVVGRIHTPELAEKILRDGDADLIVMGRPLLADPELPNKAASGRQREIRRCISCQNCIDSMESRAAMDCAINPRTGREHELQESPIPAAPEAQRRVIVVGGGPAGLEAARVAALRGHEVELHEGSRRLGGALVAASTVHAENQFFLDWLLDQVRRLEIEIHLASKLDADAIRARKPDAVIIATGGALVRPSIPGDQLPFVLSGKSLRGAMIGEVNEEASHWPAWRRQAVRALAPFQRFLPPDRIRELTRSFLPLGRRVVIVGADLAAIELAEFLAERGRRIFVLASEPTIAPEVGGKRRTEHMDRLDRLGVTINLEVEVESIRREGVDFRRSGFPKRTLGADHVILAGDVNASTELFDEVSPHVAQCYAAGDCTGYGLIQKAVLEGARAAQSIT